MANRERGRDMLKGLTVGLGVLALVTATVGTASAQSKCTAAKLKAAGKKAACKLGVEAGAAGKNVAPDPLKLGKCTSSFTAAFSKAEASTSPCVAPNGDTTAIENKVDAFVNDVNSTEVGSNTLPSKCIAAKLKAAGKKASCKLGIYSKAAAKALAPDPIKLAACGTKFTAASQKADAGTTCGTASGDAGTIEGKVDAFVNDTNTELTQAGATCAP